MSITPDQLWCGLCVAYADHDTGHHGSQGFVSGDIVKLTESVSTDYQHLVGKQGRVDGVKPGQVTVAIPGRTGTMTITVPNEAVVLVR